MKPMKLGKHWTETVALKHRRIGVTLLILITGRKVNPTKLPVCLASTIYMRFIAMDSHAQPTVKMTKRYWTDMASPTRIHSFIVT